MDEKAYQALIELVDIFRDCYVDGEEISCFKLIKKIVDGEVIKESLDEETRLLAQRQ
ncbi:hypothetical protein [Clostridium sp. AN503]|uniref:hypothetical protein n=1 Tax=Clostridium sp. AN503 TaxID=3160598 RepID=UPI0034592618